MSSNKIRLPHYNRLSVQCSHHPPLYLFRVTFGCRNLIRAIFLSIINQKENGDYTTGNYTTTILFQKTTTQYVATFSTIELLDKSNKRASMADKFLLFKYRHTLLRGITPAPLSSPLPPFPTLLQLIQAPLSPPLPSPPNRTANTPRASWHMGSHLACHCIAE